jgi:hypothetical protein
METSVITLRPAALSTATCEDLVRRTLGTVPSVAFQHACGELTGVIRCCGGCWQASSPGGISGTDADLPHLRRLTQGTVSCSVLLQLGGCLPVRWRLPVRSRCSAPRPPSAGPGGSRT